jgi:hypothetical protein
MKCTGLQARVLLITKVARQLKSGCCAFEPPSPSNTPKHDATEKKQGKGVIRYFDFFFVKRF